MDDEFWYTSYISKHDKFALYLTTNKSTDGFTNHDGYNYKVLVPSSVNINSPSYIYRKKHGTNVGRLFISYTDDMNRLKVLYSDDGFKTFQALTGSSIRANPSITENEKGDIIILSNDVNNIRKTVIKNGTEVLLADEVLRAGIKPNLSENQPTNYSVSVYNFISGDEVKVGGKYLFNKYSKDILYYKGYENEMLTGGFAESYYGMNLNYKPIINKNKNDITITGINSNIAYPYGGVSTNYPIDLSQYKRVLIECSIEGVMDEEIQIIRSPMKYNYDGNDRQIRYLKDQGRSIVHTLDVSNYDGSMYVLVWLADYQTGRAKNTEMRITKIWLE
jgi:hypothetical protein